MPRRSHAKAGQHLSVFPRSPVVSGPVVTPSDRHIVGQAPGGNLPNPIPGGGYGNVGAVALGTNFVAGTQTPAWTEKVHRRKGNVLLSEDGNLINPFSVVVAGVTAVGRTKLR